MWWPERQFLTRPAMLRPPVWRAHSLGGAARRLLPAALWRALADRRPGPASADGRGRCLDRERHNGTPTARIAVEVRNDLIFDLHRRLRRGDTDPSAQDQSLAQQPAGDRRHHHRAPGRAAVRHQCHLFARRESAPASRWLPGQTFARVSYDNPGQAAALRQRARPARRRKPRRQGDCRKHHGAAGVVFHRRHLNRLRLGVGACMVALKTSRRRRLRRAPQSGAADRAGVRPRRRPRARARREDHQRLGRRSERSVRAGSPRRRRARLGAVAAGRGGAHRAAVRRQARGLGQGRQPQFRRPRSKPLSPRHPPIAASSSRPATFAAPRRCARSARRRSSPRSSAATSTASAISSG